MLTNLKGAPQSVLIIISCYCKTITMCSRWLCGCPKNNLSFNYDCGSYQETNFRNTENTCDFSDDQ